MGLAQLARASDSIADLTQTLRERLRETLIQLRIWAPAYVFALGAGLIEGFLWQRQQVFAGFLPHRAAPLGAGRHGPGLDGRPGAGGIGLAGGVVRRDGWALLRPCLTLLAGRPLVR